jgi:RNA polymerase sigma-70 factor (ECF subfamily)
MESKPHDELSDHTEKIDQEAMKETFELLDLHKKGDEQALDTLFRRYIQDVVHLVELRLGPSLRKKIDVQDVTQEVFNKALLRLDTFTYQSKGSFLHWLSMIAVNLIRDQVDHFLAKKRGGDRKVFEGTEGGGILARISAAVKTPSEVFSIKEAKERLYKFLDQLDEKDRELIIMFYLEQLSRGEIAEILKCSKEAAGKRIARALKKLSEFYD